MTQTARGTRYASFFVLMAAVNSMALLSHNPTLRTALFFDCALTVPLGYWLLLVRPGLRGRASLALIAAVSVMRGAYLLNSRAGMIIGVAAEAALVVFVATRVKRLEDILPSKTLARIFRAEFDVYRYAFGTARPPENGCFTIHEASGAASLFWLIACLTPLEAGLMHFILPAKFAWILTALSAYSAVWMIAVARSFRALPIVVDDRGVTLRKGMLASLYVPHDAIVSISRQGGGEGFAQFAMLSDPTIHITFSRPLRMELPMGFTRQVRGASVAPDKLADFEIALNEKRTSGPASA